MKILKKIGPWLLSAAFCLLAVEMLGVAMFYQNTRSLVYLDKPKVAVPEPPTATVYKRHFHPYFGYAGPYLWQGPAYTNNLGFVQLQHRESQIPFKPGPNDFVVFIFGGSIAARLVNNPQGVLQQAFQKLPQLAGKNVLIYNMAQGPGKQPQQLMELTFLFALGQHIDLVLNLDGTLEFVSGILNFESGVDPIFPPVDVMGAIGRELAPADSSSADYYEMAYRVTHARAESERYALLRKNSRSGVAYLKNMFLEAIYRRRLEEWLKTYDQTIAGATGWDAVRKVTGLDMPIKTSKEKVDEYIFGIWLRCSDLMKTAANGQGAQYLNIVHPNPYHSRKAFTEYERAVLSLPESNYIRHGSSTGLALIESRAEMLKSRGIVSGITLFDDIADTIYIDSTGPLSPLGETMFADFVASQVGRRLGSP